MIRLQHLVAHPRGALHQWILAPTAFREGDDVANAGAAQQHRHQPIEAERDPRVGGTARPQHLDQMREFGQSLGGQLEDVAQNVQLHLRMVDPTAATAELDAVHHEVVVVGQGAARVGCEDGDVFGAAWRGEGMVGGDQSLVGIVGWREGSEEREMGDPERRETTGRGKAGGFDTGIVEGEAQHT